MRDLNHYKPAYRALAKITLLDWMCKKNDCSYPLGGDGLKKDFSHLDQSIPSAWLTAHQVLKKLDLSLIETDQSYITEGDVSLSHIVCSCSHNNLQILVNVNGIALRSLQVKGVRRLADTDNWMIDVHSNISAHLIQPVFDRSWSTATRLNWWKLFDMLHGQVRIDNVLCGSPDLAIPQQVQKRQAENLISSLANVCGFAPSRLADVSTWPLDGSMLTPSAGMLDRKTVVGAATGAWTQIPGTNISILHGELVGLILALVLLKDTRIVDQHKHHLLTNHLNTIQLV